MSQKLLTATTIWIKDSIQNNELEGQIGNLILETGAFEDCEIVIATNSQNTSYCVKCKFDTIEYIENVENVNIKTIPIPPYTKNRVSVVISDLKVKVKAIDININKKITE